ncbi:MAG TPA: type II toxin-antitoxin system VapC family toxin [Anaerolineae bacterium]
MADYYVDSSVLVKRHVDEAGSAWFRALADPAAGNLIITTRISAIEVYSALNRRLREARLDPADYNQIADDFGALCATEYELIELTPSLIARTRAVLERHPLRAYDAIQLASALVAGEALAQAGLPPLTFLSADDRLLNAAQAYGLMTDNPNRYP